MKKVQLYTDGACSGNPGAGGWGVALIYGEIKKELSGFCAETTNNRMEITAVIEGLKALKEPCEVVIFSDSAYTVDAFLKGWIENWQKNSWRTSAKEAVKNQDLWEELLLAMRGHNITWTKVKGHSDNVMNNRCDFLARDEIKKHA